MARKASRRVTSSGRKSTAGKSRKSSASKRGGAANSTAKAASSRRSQKVTAESLLRLVRTLHDFGLVAPFVRSAKRAGLTFTVDASALEKVQRSMRPRIRKAVPAAAGRGPESRASVKSIAGGAATAAPVAG